MKVSQSWEQNEGVWEPEEETPWLTGRGALRDAWRWLLIRIAPFRTFGVLWTLAGNHLDRMSSFFLTCDCIMQM